MGVSFSVLIPPLKLWDMAFFTRYDIYLRGAVVCLSLGIWGFRLWKEKRIDSFVAWFTVFLGIMVFSTLLHDGDLKQALWGEAVIPFTVLILVINCIRKDEKKTVRVLYVLYLLFSLINFYTVINGSTTEDYFFANRNLHVYFYLIPLFCGFYGLAKGYLRNRFVYVGYYLLCLAATYLAGGLTTAFVLLFWGVFLVFRSSGIIARVLNAKMSLIEQSALFAVTQLCCFVPTAFLGRVFELIGRDVTFSGRDTIWKPAWKLISKAPVFGYGMVDLKEYIGFRHAHNIFLQILCRRGIVGIAVFLILMGSLYKAASSDTVKEIRNLGLVMLFCLLLAGQFDVAYIQYYSLYGALIYELAMAEKDRTGI